MAGTGNKDRTPCLYAASPIGSPVNGDFGRRRTEALIKPLWEGWAPGPFCQILDHPRDRRNEGNPPMSHHMRTNIGEEAREPPLPEQMRQVRLPFIKEGIIRTFPIEHNTAMCGDSLVLCPIRRQICRTCDWLWSVNRGLIPIGINQGRGTVAKVNWNSQLLSNQPCIIALILVVPIDDCGKR